MSGTKIHDEHGRSITYLRVSVTDRCNLRCVYCMPASGVIKRGHSEILRYEEFIEVVCAAVRLGVCKVRITGGEPLIKRGVVKLIREFNDLHPRLELALTTNGTRLAKFAHALKQAGLQRVNISLDSLRPEIYAELTRGGDVAQVLEGIDAALAEGFPVKLNTVLFEDKNLAEVPRLVELALEKGLEIRFIERMGFAGDASYVSQERVLGLLRERFAVRRLEDGAAGPHVNGYDVAGARVGFISPRSHPFCSGCNKLRLTQVGELRACLASGAAVDLRALLRRPHTAEELDAAIVRAAGLKPLVGPWTSEGEMWRVGG